MRVHDSGNVQQKIDWPVGDSLLKGIDVIWGRNVEFGGFTAEIGDRRTNLFVNGYDFVAL